LNPEDVVHVAYSIGNDWTDELAIFFRIVLTDPASREERLAEVTQCVEAAIVESIRPMEDWGLFPYSSFAATRNKKGEAIQSGHSTWRVMTNFCNRRENWFTRTRTILGKRTFAARCRRRASRTPYVGEDPVVARELRSFAGLAWTLSQALDEMLRADRAFMIWQEIRTEKIS
jgi:hypothetical protein